MQPYLFDPWLWRDPALLAGGYSQTTDDEGPDDAAPRDAETDDGGPGTEIDLGGYSVEATDGGIGSIDEASTEINASYLIVDTGPWIFGRKVLLPAGTVNRVDHLTRTVYVDRTKEQVKDSPEYDPETFHDADYRKLVGDYYTSSYRAGKRVD